MLKHVSYRSSSNFGKKVEYESYRRSSMMVTDYKENYHQNREMGFDQTNYKLSPMSSTQSSKCSDSISLRNFGNEDSISINSSFSYGSFVQSNFASRCSSTLSLSDPSAIPVKVYLRRLRPDMEYKTLPMSTATTCRQMVLSLLSKFRLRHRDPNLFYVTMEVTVRSADRAPVKRTLVLDDNSRPAELQQCRPKGEARFSIGLRSGGLIRVHDSILMPGSQYKSLLIAQHTTSAEVIQLLLSCYSKTDSPKFFSIHEVCQSPFKDRPLQDVECPLDVQTKWPRCNRTNRCFIIRRNSVYNFHLKSKLSWRRSLDQGSTDTESEPDEHNTTRASIISSSSTSSGISSISLDSTSSGVSSGDDSCISVSSPLKFSQRVLHSMSASSLYVFKTPVRQNIFPKTSTPLNSPSKLSSLKLTKLSTSKLSIISDISPVEDKPENVSAKYLCNTKSTVNIESVIPVPPKPTESQISQLQSNEASIPLDPKPREVIVDKSNGPIHSDLHPKSSPRRFSIMPVFSTDIRYSRLNSQESRKLPPTPSVPPRKLTPKPVPRTLFPPIRSRSLGRDACLQEQKVDDSGCDCADHDAGCTMHTNNPHSSVSFGVLSHSSPRKAKIRSLSKSFGNLSVTALKEDTKSVSSKSYKKKFVENEEKMSNPKESGCGDLKISRSLTISLHNLADDGQCKRNCQNCFYI